MKYDVVIVGGGPAGILAACLLKDRQENLNVVLVEKKRFPYSKNFGSILNRQIFELFPFLKTYKDQLIDSEIQSCQFISPDGKKEQIYEEKPNLAYLVNKSSFDNTLIQIAKEKNVKCVFGKPVIHVETGVDGVTVTLKGGRKIEGEVLLGADGVDSVVASSTGISASASDDIYYSQSMILERSKSSKTLSPMISLCFNQIMGYAFLFPLNNFWHFGVFSLDESNLSPTFGIWKNQLIEQKIIPLVDKTHKSMYLQNPAGQALLREKSYEKRTLLIGDAGGFVAKTTGEGLYPAMYSAKIATDLLLEGFENNNLDELIPTYSRRWNLEFGDYIQGAIQLHSNLTFLIHMIFSDPKICARYAKGFFHGEKVL